MIIEIIMPNVGDGDAIIIHLQKPDDNLIILIDGGHSGDSGKIIEILDPLLIRTQKEGPDLIVCTHFDADHIGGLKKIAKNYKERIGRVWIHMPNLEEAVSLAGKVNERRNLNEGDVGYLRNMILGSRELSDVADFVLESYSDMAELVRFLKETNILIEEPFAGTSFPGWPEIEVLGPTETFYRTLLPKLTDPREVIKEELQYEAQKILNFNEYSDIRDNPCKFLDGQKKDRVTAVNQASIIIQITAKQKKYLFTGDAGLESFEAIPGYPNSLANIYWLKVAHHGSHNNSSSNLFDIMKPKYAYISGRKYLDLEVSGCLTAKGAVVKTTLKDGDLRFPE